MKKKILVGVIVAVAIVGFIAYNKFSEVTPDIVNRKPDKSVTVKELVAAFDRDTASASKEYLDKIVEVKGIVKDIDTTGSVVLGENGTESSVVCGLDRRHMKDYEKIKLGEMATIQGVLAGYEKASGDDLLASLVTTVQLRSSGVKN
jgi:hypothetical protein